MCPFIAFLYAVSKKTHRQIYGISAPRQGRLRAEKNTRHFAVLRYIGQQWGNLKTNTEKMELNSDVRQQFSGTGHNRSSSQDHDPEHMAKIIPGHGGEGPKC